MLDWFLRLTQQTRNLRRKAYDCMDAHAACDPNLVSHLKEYMAGEVSSLKGMWPQDLRRENLDKLVLHVRTCSEDDIDEMLRRDIPGVEQDAERRLLDTATTNRSEGFVALLHPTIIKSALPHFEDGHYRDAVLNSIIAVFDHLRARTGVDADGSQLVGKVLGGQNPTLVFSEFQSESGRNDQEGFLKIFLGAYQGIRNPKAHSLSHDLDRTKAAQYLVFASLLARRLDEASITVTP